MIELLTSDEMAVADRLTISGGVSGLSLMEQAGAAVAAAAERLTPSGGKILVVAGPGNNGGDGYVAARLLQDRGYRAGVLLIGDPRKMKGAAAAMARRWQGPVCSPDPQMLTQADTLVDALFGAGLDRPVEGAAAQIIGAMNASGRPIVAVDLPSGINGNTGEIMGIAVFARDTVTFFRRKPGHLLMPGREHCGRVTLAQIGIEETVLKQIRPQTFVNHPNVWRDTFPVPGLRSHKYTRGHAVVVSGAMPRTGAARLAARAALRAGAGLVTIASPPDALAVHAAATLAVMVEPAGDARALAALLADPRFNAVLLGPGGGVGAPMRELVLTALQGPRAVVLDADALTSFSDQPDVLFTALAGRATAAVLTPHEGEFARLFGSKVGPTQKLERARMAAKICGATVVIKGADTVIAAPDGRAAVAENAPPWLATAGSGDVLAGMMLGLLAQGMGEWEAASAAVWLHGECAGAVGPGLISEDLSEAIPEVYRALFAELGASEGVRVDN